jgi:hypothetical protein
MTLRFYAVPSVLAMALLAQTPVFAQTGKWVAPRTPDGVPDLQGVWTNFQGVPLQRPKELGTKEFYTKEEAARKGIQTDRPAPQEVHYDPAQFGVASAQEQVVPNLRTSLIVGPEGRIPPQTPEAQKRNAARAAWNKIHEFDGPETRPLGEQCILWPQEGPPTLPTGYNSNLQIVQGPGYVAILQEMIHDVRMIPTDGRPHLPESIRQWRGDSRGHWEGDTLVVDTTNFTDRTAFQGSSEHLHVVERFTRTGPDRILYQFTVDDPHTWIKPWSAEIPWARMAGPIYEYACHEANYGIANNLSGARAEERKAAETQK